MFPDEPDFVFSAPSINLENVRITSTYTPVEGITYSIDRYQDRDESFTVEDLRELIPTLQKLVEDADYFNATTNEALMADIANFDTQKSTITDLANIADKHNIKVSLAAQILGL